MKFRIETCFQGNGYVGQDAANDAGWIDELYRGLNHLWNTQYEGFTDNFFS